jgi:hypothetical protein
MRAMKLLRRSPCLVRSKLGAMPMVKPDSTLIYWGRSRLQVVRRRAGFAHQRARLRPAAGCFLGWHLKRQHERRPRHEVLCFPLHCCHSEGLPAWRGLDCGAGWGLLTWYGWLEISWRFAGGCNAARDVLSCGVDRFSGCGPGPGGGVYEQRMQTEK